MGEAFDQSGRKIGEAFGSTKKEVFDKLAAEHPNAAEIRIKTIAEQMQKDHEEFQREALGAADPTGPRPTTDEIDKIIQASADFPDPLGQQDGRPYEPSGRQTAQVRIAIAIQKAERRLARLRSLLKVAEHAEPGTTLEVTLWCLTSGRNLDNL